VSVRLDGWLGSSADYSLVGLILNRKVPNGRTKLDEFYMDAFLIGEFLMDEFLMNEFLMNEIQLSV